MVYKPLHFKGSTDKCDNSGGNKIYLQQTSVRPGFSIGSLPTHNYPSANVCKRIG